jgi:hypothetical protein
VQSLLSSHGLSSALAGSLQIPVDESQVPTSWHWSEAVHTTGLAPWHCPERQVSPPVHALPSLQTVPSGFAGSEHFPVFESHVPTS